MRGSQFANMLRYVKRFYKNTKTTVGLNSSKVETISIAHLAHTETRDNGASIVSTTMLSRNHGTRWLRT